MLSRGKVHLCMTVHQFVSLLFILNGSAKMSFKLEEKRKERRGKKAISKLAKKPCGNYHVSVCFGVCLHFFLSIRLKSMLKSQQILT